MVAGRIKFVRFPKMRVNEEERNQTEGVKK